MGSRLAQTTTRVSARIDQTAEQPRKRRCRWRRVLFGVLLGLVVFLIFLWWYLGLTLEYVYY
jgi:cell division septal protein FtsQ